MGVATDSRAIRKKRRDREEKCRGRVCGEPTRVSARFVVARVDIASRRAGAGREAGIAMGKTRAALFREHEHVPVTRWTAKGRRRDQGRIEEEVSEQISRTERNERGEFKSVV